jgi:phytoene desaturase
VSLVRDGEAVDVAAPVVVSNIGPWGTADLAGYTVEAEYRPCSMITVNFASQKRLIEAPGMLSFAKSKRLAYIANYTDICPEMSPEGWNLYVGTAVPSPAIGDFDEKAETEVLLDDLREQIPGFDTDARILSIVTTRDGWPPQRAVAGYDLPHDTPVVGLWNVGDAVKEYANGGTTACAETAEIIVGKIQAQFQPA